ncbi:unnamed protein product, partial [Ectocarpus sp. 12 AP-2014]
MPNWLASELCMVASFSLGAWKTFKVLKHGGTDYNLLKTWCLLGLLRAFEEYFEFLVSWIPFYWLGKCLGLGLLYLPGGNIPTVVFERVVVWGMDNAHHVLNNLVVPNVVEFAVSLPWRVLLVLFPTMPAPSSGSGSGAAKKKKAGRGAGLRKKQAVTGGGLTSQLQHLNAPTKKRAAESTPKRAASAGAPSIQHQTPPLPARGSPSKTTPVVARNGVANASSDSKHGGGGASALVAELLDADGGTGVASRADGAAAIATPVPFGDDIATSPESGGSERRSGGGGRPSRRRSFGEIIRSAVTGNSEVRLRDHLFDFSTASPAPPVPSGGGGGVTKPAMRAASKEPVVPKEASSSASTTLPAVVNGNGKRRGREKVAVDAVIPARSRHTTRRRPSEFSDPVADGGGGGGDEAGGGRSSDGSGRVGREGVRRRNGGAGAGTGATGRGILREGKNALSSLLSSSSATAAPGSSSSSATRSARTPADRRGRAATAGVARGGPRGTSARAGAGATASLSSSAAAIADSRAKRLAEWRKKRADRAREEQAEKYRRSNNNFDGGGGEGY